ncbi:CG11865 [Drosophila busckii]|uniref:Metalloendopeptidase n=1 Tax=Drosophila busckii TaxID=30019 RepID=A0A0M4F3C9_DROBS|nr:zinc metalloproteinase nas-4 [Drosophila busckii]ALC45707.1 CG11865 [Drosophila busckii]
MHCLKVTLCSLLLLALNLVQALPAQQSKQQIRIDDMLLTTEQFEYLNGTDMPQSALAWPQYYWPQSTLVFSISTQFTPYEVQKIQEAMAEIESVSCIRFRQTDNIKENRVAIQRIAGMGCFSALGYQHNVQPLSLDTGCMHKGTIQHELLHALGFIHMQNDPRRDDYVIINWGNIIEGAESQFQMWNPFNVNNFGVAYDYASIMHYSAFAFSKNGQRTIIPKVYGAQIGLRKLSPWDIVKLKLAYCLN